MNDEMMREFLKMVAKKLAEDSEMDGPKAPPVTVGDILLDFKIFANDVYEGRVTEEDEDSLVVVFRNGQKFRVTIREIKMKLSE